MKLARTHVVLLAAMLIAMSVAYTVLAIIAPPTAIALGVGYIGFVLAASLILRLFR